jgi:hypothetical protein
VIASTHGSELRQAENVQRGGVPCAFDRLSATLLGTAAVERIHADQHGVLLGLIGGRVTQARCPRSPVPPSPSSRTGSISRRCWPAEGQEGTHPLI